MQETTNEVVEMNDIAGPVLQALINAMYGKELPSGAQQVLDLYIAADAHQVRITWVLQAAACVHQK